MTKCNISDIHQLCNFCDRNTFNQKVPVYIKNKIEQFWLTAHNITKNTQNATFQIQRRLPCHECNNCAKKVHSINLFNQKNSSSKLNRCIVKLITNQEY